MARIIWTPQALADLENIAEYISKDSRKFASIFVENILEIVANLELFPESGRIVPELQNSKIREILSGNYRIIYSYKSDLVEILTVFHSARLWNNQ
ncbi:MAG: type II toxin-antitoxin system RelE/ParE family toxin [Spirochaetaceae bacterium]|nr:type II toxin-antitoxin system RelE/ParE family toxin [Spirochaetaceae bacterium]